MQSDIRKSNRKELTGTVVSDKMQKTIVVEVGRLTLHSKFKKRVRLYNKFKAHDEKNEAKIGDIVMIQSIRPLSKDKRWKLIKVLEKIK